MTTQAGCGLTVMGACQAAVVKTFFVAFQLICLQETPSAAVPLIRRHAEWFSLLCRPRTVHPWKCFFTTAQAGASLEKKKGKRKRTTEKIL